MRESHVAPRTRTRKELHSLPPFSLSLSLSLPLHAAFASSASWIALIETCVHDGAEAASGTLLRISSLALLTCFAG